MGVRNYLIEGVSGTGKTAVCDELNRRGFRAIHGDRELAYQGDSGTGLPTTGTSHANHIWDVGRVRALAARQDQPVTFFCGGSRNFSRYLDVFDAVFVLHIDRDTLLRRLDARPPGEWGAAQEERDLVVRLHETSEDIPKGDFVIDATGPLEHVVDTIVDAASLHRPGPSHRHGITNTEP
ncbi:nucleoside kinase [Rhodococcoides trifolii]|uniref:Nucleoside kinase n=1 Tax=Rhodococcoides trifolii TaxID=908250 RepID=A0A917G2A8_9NOCA|nr:AAA family ATPase [Rhodococcus trifolii]GGG19326.1 nucleoside kinase [Rhodococcus trifolii]